VPKLTPAAFTFSELAIEVFRLNGLLLEAGNVLTKPMGLSSARWQVLGAVRDGPSPVSNVARMMGLTRQSVQQVADALSRDGFIEYVDNPHHRTAKLISMTAAGRQALQQIDHSHVVWANRLAKRLDMSDLRAALDGLRHAREVLEQDASSPAGRARRR
jgi:DNA-binding MarR family transcriptional regulator